MSIEINWKVEDGYVNNGPQSFELDSEELLDCGSVEGALKLVEDFTQQEFNNRISWCFSNYDEFKAEIEKLFAEAGKAEAK